ncbi:hypothetical protein [Marinifilum flexuosum]|uniref:Uncharacterized protein n=1 Tax=Marinifilum flexuosum TaxID=1117708 RepID=A0A419WMU7_9BACT|nr:hypothetical protein [Marinifilum flexuosum]RKD96762.1 hypothetical protein BXY64_3708 [Marinifilum flexuosum]
MEKKEIITIDILINTTRQAEVVARLRTLGVSMIEVSEASNKLSAVLNKTAKPLKILDSNHRSALHRTDILTQSQKRDPAYQRHQPHYKYHR